MCRNRHNKEARKKGTEKARKREREKEGLERRRVAVTLALQTKNESI